MTSHAPAGYECPFCALVAGIRWTTPEERAPYAERLALALADYPPRT